MDVAMVVFGCCTCCNGYKHMFQEFVQNVSSASDVYYMCFIYMLMLQWLCCICMFQIFHLFQMYVAIVLSEYYKSRFERRVVERERES
jgi:Ca2+/H+ antiporter